MQAISMMSQSQRLWKDTDVLSQVASSLDVPTRWVRQTQRLGKIHTFCLKSVDPANYHENWTTKVLRWLCLLPRDWKLRDERLRSWRNEAKHELCIVTEVRAID